ncbi:hypothetical protein [Metamycoplasma buccale]|uniref:hypothetical protein n=1 Tax=Metamycoplasma buccale TaxID=55602 RepID=UPI00398F46AE
MIEKTMHEKRRMIKDYCSYAKIEQCLNKFHWRRNAKSKLEAFIESLDKDDKLIFIENFMVKNNDPLWYLEHWCKGTYYKKLNYVSNLFMRFINANSK